MMVGAADRLAFSTLSCVAMGAPATVPYPLERLAEAVGAAGFGRIGLDWFTLRDAERRGVRPDLGGLEPTELCALGLGEDPSADERVARSMARRCAELGIPVCVLAATVPVSDALCRRVAAVAALFGDTRVAIEFLPYSGVRTLAEARALSARTGCGIVVDTLHLLRSGGRPTDLADTDDLAVVQLADGAAEPPATAAWLAEESRTARLLPGTGVVDFAGLAATLGELGYRGPLTLEVLSDRLRRLPLEQFLSRARTAALAALA